MFDAVKELKLCVQTILMQNLYNLSSVTDIAIDNIVTMHTLLRSKESRLLLYP